MKQHCFAKQINYMNVNDQMFSVRVYVWRVCVYIHPFSFNKSSQNRSAFSYLRASKIIITRRTPNSKSLLFLVFFFIFLSFYLSTSSYPHSVKLQSLPFTMNLYKKPFFCVGRLRLLLPLPLLLL